MAKAATPGSRDSGRLQKGQIRTIVSWCLYDFANSFYVVLPAVAWQVYYQNAIVGNADGQGDLWWGRTISTPMLIVAITSPMMRAIANFAGVRKRLLIA